MAKLKTMTVKVKDNQGQEQELTVALVGPAGHPLYEIDGKEVELDAPILRSDLSKLNAEDAGWRHKYRQLEEKMAVFDGIDPDKAKEALATIGNLKDKELLDAKQVETMKAQWEQSFLENKKRSDDTYELKIKDLTTQLETEKGNIKRMLIKNAFLGSDFLKNTIYDPVRDDAYKIFGDRFDVVPGENGDFRVVHKLADGGNLISVARPGQVATFDEAIEHIITSHPQKAHILKGSQASGSGAQGGGSGGAKTTLQQLQERYIAAQKAGNVTEMVSLKDQIHAAGAA